MSDQENEPEVDILELRSRKIIQSTNDDEEEEEEEFDTLVLRNRVVTETLASVDDLGQEKKTKSARTSRASRSAKVSSTYASKKAQDDDENDTEEEKDEEEYDTLSLRSRVVTETLSPVDELGSEKKAKSSRNSRASKSARVSSSSKKENKPEEDDTEEEEYDTLTLRNRVVTETLSPVDDLGQEEEIKSARTPRTSRGAKVSSSSAKVSTSSAKNSKVSSSSAKVSSSSAKSTKGSRSSKVSSSSTAKKPLENGVEDEEEFDTLELRGRTVTETLSPLDDIGVEKKTSSAKRSRSSRKSKSSVTNQAAEPQEEEFDTLELRNRVITETLSPLDDIGQEGIENGEEVQEKDDTVETEVTIKRKSSRTSRASKISQSSASNQQFDTLALRNRDVTETLSPLDTVSEEETEVSDDDGPPAKKINLDLTPTQLFYKEHNTTTYHMPIIYKVHQSPTKNPEEAGGWTPKFVSPISFKERFMVVEESFSSASEPPPTTKVETAKPKSSLWPLRLF